MANISLKPRALLDNFDHNFGSVRLRELPSMAIVSMAVPQGDEAKCEAAITKVWECDAPDNGRYSNSSDGKSRIMRTQPDQYFALFDHDGDDARNTVHGATGGSFWTTEQTDAWCVLEISGPQSREALARICPLDLHKDVFGADHFGRTSMEHLGAFVLRTGEDEFILMSARSSAKSFLHAVETSIKNVMG